jgi:uncharacterized protein YjiS (DUF1127 family)
MATDGGTTRPVEETDMSVFESKRPVPFGAVLTFRAVSLLDRAVEAVGTWRRVRATEKALLKLSDRQLADVGLHRGDITAVAEQMSRA